jgi:hypothetical protein
MHDLIIEFLFDFDEIKSVSLDLCSCMFWTLSFHCKFQIHSMVFIFLMFVFGKQDMGAMAWWFQVQLFYLYLTLLLSDSDIFKLLEHWVFIVNFEFIAWFFIFLMFLFVKHDMGAMTWWFQVQLFYLYTILKGEHEPYFLTPFINIH